MPTWFYPNVGTARNLKATLNVPVVRWYPGGPPGYTHFWVKVSHSATNPFCENTGPAINYNWDVRVDESRAYAIAGFHDNAPTHEIYYGTSWSAGDSANWVTVHQSNVNSFACLFGPPLCSQVQIRNGVGSAIS